MRATLLSIGLVLALAAPTLAQGCEPSTTTPTLTVHAYGGHGIYVYEPCLDASPRGQGECADWGPTMLWIYQESNGIPGLQRQDENVDDTCGGMIDGDTVVF